MQKEMTNIYWKYSYNNGCESEGLDTKLINFWNNLTTRRPLQRNSPFRRSYNQSLYELLTSKSSPEIKLEVVHIDSEL